MKNEKTQKYIIFILAFMMLLTIMPTRMVSAGHSGGEVTGKNFPVTKSTTWNMKETSPDSTTVKYNDGTFHNVSDINPNCQVAQCLIDKSTMKNAVGDFLGDLKTNWEEAVIQVDADSGEFMTLVNPETYAKNINEAEHLSPELKAGYLEFMETLPRDKNGNIQIDHLGVNALKKFLKEKYGNDPEKVKRLLNEIDKKKPTPIPTKPLPPPRENCKRHDRTVCDGPCCPQNYPPGPWEPLPQYDRGRTIVGLHSTKITVSPVVPVNFGTLAPQDQKAWRETHEYQESAITMLPFGVYSMSLANSGMLDALRKEDEAEANAIWGSISKDMQMDGRQAAYDFYGSDSTRSLMRKSNLIADTLETLSKTVPSFNNSFIYLSENNKIGFARGGVFTVTRYVRKMETTFWHQHRRRMTYKCNEVKYREEEYDLPDTCEHSNGRVGWDTCEARECVDYDTECDRDEYGYKTNCSSKCVQYKTYEYKCCKGTVRCHYQHVDHTKAQAAFNKYEYGVDPAVSKVTTNLLPWETWSSTQYIGVRCNTTQLEALLRRVGGEFLKRDNFWSIGKSPILSAKDYPGNRGIDLSTQAGALYSANSFDDLDVNFFYPNGHVSVKDGDVLDSCVAHTKCSPLPESAVENSDAKNNKSGKTAEDPQKYGAQVNGVEGKEFQLFRDGEKKPIRVDVPTPVFDSEIVSLPEKSEKTIIARWEEGTPKDTNEYQLDTESGIKLFRDKNKSIEVLEGEINRFNVSSTWAAEANYPQKYTFTYRYRPIIRSDVPSMINEEHAERPDSISEDMFIECVVNFNADSKVVTASDYSYAESSTKRDLEVKPFQGSDPDVQMVIDYIKSGMN